MQIFDHKIGFWEKRHFFRRKLSKIAENCDHRPQIWISFQYLRCLANKPINNMYSFIEYKTLNWHFFFSFIYSICCPYPWCWWVCSSTVCKRCPWLQEKGIRDTCKDFKNILPKNTRKNWFWPKLQLLRQKEIS
jgi:hypothetical protein